MREFGPPQVELWFSDSAVRRIEEEGFRGAANDDVLLGTVDVADLPLPEASRTAYLKMTAICRAHGYGHFLRIWNHVRDINEAGCTIEKYREFCLGRHDAFAELGYALKADLPAASAVGTRAGGPLVIYFLAAREPGEQIENPRQVSAFEYPREYGPRSPSFSRATIRRWRNGAQLFLAGTASIVGHETVHIGDVPKQFDETMRNIELLIAEAERKVEAPARGLERLRTIKTYVRHAKDYDLIASRLRAVSGDAELVFVEADICRSELLLEIEAVAEI